MPSMTMNDPETAVLERTLNNTHRCDRCNAQAFVAIQHTLEDTGLLFCGHHFATHAEVIRSAGVWMVTDERDHINSRPSASSGTAGDDEE